MVEQIVVNPKLKIGLSNHNKASLLIAKSVRKVQLERLHLPKLFEIENGQASIFVHINDCFDIFC